MVRLLDPVSTVIVMDESLIDSLTATSGSGPAYVFYLAESMMKTAMDLGLDQSTARTLVTETIAGSALLLASEPDDPAALRAAVTSPRRDDGGCHRRLRLRGPLQNHRERNAGGSRTSR